MTAHMTEGTNMGTALTASGRGGSELAEMQAKLRLVENVEVTVKESDSMVRTGITVQKGDTLIFTASGSIWAGVWLTGTNGPNGWNNIDNDLKFPLPGTHPFCLLGVLSRGPFFVGSYCRLDGTAFEGELFMEINDDVHGNGNGAFTCQIQQYRG